MLYKTLFILSWCTFSTAATYAKPKTNRDEISVAVGKWTPIPLFRGVHAGKDGYSEYPVDHYSGTFAVTYRYHLSRKNSLGIAVAYENESGGWFHLKNLGNRNGPDRFGTYKRNLYTIAAEARTLYSRNRNKLVFTYGYIGVGITFRNEVDAYSLEYYNSQFNNGANQLSDKLEIQSDQTHFNIQLCPIGISVGGNIRGYVEAGFGYKGLFCAGLSYNL